MGDFGCRRKHLTLTEIWSGDTDTLQIGDSPTRTIVMRATGQRGEQLPEVTVPPQPIVKIYPDKAKTQTDFDGKWVVGSREEKYRVGVDAAWHGDVARHSCSLVEH